MCDAWWCDDDLTVPIHCIVHHIQRYINVKSHRMSFIAYICVRTCTIHTIRIGWQCGPALYQSLNGFYYTFVNKIQRLEYCKFVSLAFCRLYVCSIYITLQWWWWCKDEYMNTRRRRHRMHSMRIRVCALDYIEKEFSTRFLRIFEQLFGSGAFFCVFLSLLFSIFHSIRAFYYIFCVFIFPFITVSLGHTRIADCREAPPYSNRYKYCVEHASELNELKDQIKRHAMQPMRSPKNLAQIKKRLLMQFHLAAA